LVELSRSSSSELDAAAGIDRARFELRGVLGKGGAGIVFRAFDRQLGREVALKWLRQASGRDLFRFKREFRALADIVHPNLVALHELTSSDGAWYFTMELVEGVSFLAWARLDEARLRGALAQLVDALLALHRAGKLHRDLKPSNVLVTATGRVALLDFGLVETPHERVTGAERIAVGTPAYMSPEQAADQPLGEASDWYSLGAMLYEALAARRPFEGTASEIMSRKQSETPPPPGGAADLSRLALALLAADPARRPGGAELLAALGTQPSASTRGMRRSDPPASFVGRAAELGALSRALAEARRGGVAVLVKGKSGLGKSTLVRRFLRGLGDAVFALAGRCFERESVPFKMLDGVVDELTGVLLGLSTAQLDALAPRDLGSLVRLFPVLRRVPLFGERAGASPPPPDPQELRRRGFQALRTLIARLARMKPVVLFVDDAHWGDADSAAFLAELIHGAEPGLLIIVAHRPEDYLGVVAQLKRPRAGRARSGDVRDLEVHALSDEDAAAIVSPLAPSEANVAAIVAAAGGNPLILVELARGGANPSAPPQQLIAALVRERAQRLPPEAQAMLAVSSVAARPLPVAIAAHAAGVVGGRDEAAQLSAERLATLRQAGGEMILHPAHDYVRAAMLATLDPEERAGWHEALARAFEAVQGPEQLDAQAVVEHWLAAGHPAQAAHHAVTAAERAEDALAFRRAAELYEIALAYGPWDALGQRDLLRHKAHALACAGLLDEAAATYAHAAQLLNDAESIDLERLHVEALLRRGRFDEALPAAEKLLAQVGVRAMLVQPRTPRAGLAAPARLASWMQMKLRGLDYTAKDVGELSPAALRAVDALYSIASSLAFTDPGLGRPVQTELLRAALAAGEPVRVCLALALEIIYAAAPGTRNRGAVDAVGAKLAVEAARTGLLHVQGLADTARGIAAHRSGDWSEARTLLERGLETLREHGAGVRWELNTGEMVLLSSLFYLGEWREQTRLARGLLRDAIDRGDAAAQAAARANVFAWLAIDRGAEAAAELEAARKSLGPAPTLSHALLAHGAVSLALYRGDRASAQQQLAEVWPICERLGLLRIQQMRCELLSLRARAYAAEPQRSDRMRAHLDATDLEREGATWATGLAHLVHASAHAAGGAVDDANASLLAAERPLHSSAMVAHLHVARLRRAQLEGGARGTARAAAERDALRECGATDPDAVAGFLVPWPRDLG
jgi:tetratricopeptide (TPR) repeat protein